MSVYAQEVHEGVTVHSDPRLSLLVKKSRDIEEEEVQEAAHKETVKHSHNNLMAMAGIMPKPAAPPVAEVTTLRTSTLMPDYPATSQADKKVNPDVLTAEPPLNATGNPVKQLPLKITADDASSTGYTGGWSPPPVHRKLKVIYSGKGYRVQIYNGPNREKAIEIKASFMRAYPGMRTYLTYVSPCFRVKVGNYRTRNEALGMLHEARSVYTPCMIVPDIITISTF